MVQFRVRAESLTEVAGHLGSVIATFDGNLAAVESQVNGVLPNWKGDDQESFQENWKAFVAMSDAVRMSLVALQNGLISASSGYDTTEMGVRRSLAQGRHGVVAVRRSTGAQGAVVAAGEERAEDMAEFFGRDYAGDREKERFGAGAVRARNGRWVGGGSEDTDGDGDSDAIGTGPYLSSGSVEELYGDAEDEQGREGRDADPSERRDGGDEGRGPEDGPRDARQERTAAFEVADDVAFEAAAADGERD
jgi:uncharacterized protein YukE